MGADLQKQHAGQPFASPCSPRYGLGVDAVDGLRPLLTFVCADFLTKATEGDLAAMQRLLDGALCVSCRLSLASQRTKNST